MQRRHCASEFLAWAQVDDAWLGPIWSTKAIADHAALSFGHNLDAGKIVARSRRGVKSPNICNSLEFGRFYCCEIRQLAEGGDFSRSAARGYSIINKLLTVDVGLSKVHRFSRCGAGVEFFV